jgi:DNA-binding transcriptional MerR regulator
MTCISPGEASARTGLSLDTLRYYESVGILGPVRRDAGGRRQYSEGDLAWLDVVKCLRASGMGIADLRRFVDVLRGQASRVTDPVEMLQTHREQLLQHIEQIKAGLAVLDDKIAHYRKAGSRTA